MVPTITDDRWTVPIQSITMQRCSTKHQHEDQRREMREERYIAWPIINLSEDIGQTESEKTFTHSATTWFQFHFEKFHSNTDLNTPQSSRHTFERTTDRPVQSIYSVEPVEAEFPVSDRPVTYAWWQKEDSDLNQRQREGDRRRRRRDERMYLKDRQMEIVRMVSEGRLSLNRCVLSRRCSSCSSFPRRWT